MTEAKKIFLDYNLRSSGFFELAIHVCTGIDNDSVTNYDM
jgi:hypothetical protein